MSEEHLDQRHVEALLRLVRANKGGIYRFDCEPSDWHRAKLAPLGDFIGISATGSRGEVVAVFVFSTCAPVSYRSTRSAPDYAASSLRTWLQLRRPDEIAGISPAWRDALMPTPALATA
jgi:hypothetical protein